MNSINLNAKIRYTMIRCRNNVNLYLIAFGQTLFPKCQTTTTMAAPVWKWKQQDDFVYKSTVKALGHRSISKVRSSIADVTGLQFWLFDGVSTLNAQSTPMELCCSASMKQIEFTTWEMRAFFGLSIRKIHGGAHSPWTTKLNCCESSSAKVNSVGQRHHQHQFEVDVIQWKQSATTQ